MIKALLIDDSEQARSIIKSIINSELNDVDIVGEADGVISGIKAIKKHQPDLIYLDVEMNDGTGFDVIDIINNENTPKIIFTTSHEHYAIKAIKYSALDYLLKPIGSQDIIDSINNFRNKEEEEKEIIERLRLLAQNVKEGQEPNKIALLSVNKYIFFEADEIIHAEAEGNLCRVHSINGKVHLVSKTLKALDEMIGGDRFLRVHKTHLINKSHISSFSRLQGDEIFMSNGNSIPVARRKVEEILKLIG